ncbi:SGNH/GDSL hydrolase family protein [Planctomicrobium piriforme]|uniref:Lysophospholipase L1 n=1 Tax=Planctomicrobium piriforme TaxID=1576369 RepID=A0A1I3AQF2_9PLAN|nr:SGNH/GDSL hydrolase family protein [Planctomicrobium piriforme]SFH52285.1 Lysophospholipase L1 [Planctomicrobium piriforme]
METVLPRQVTPVRRPLIHVRRLALVALLLGSIALGYYEFRLRRPVGSGPVAIPVPRAEFQEIWSDQKILLLGLGDSITDGFGASPGHSYFSRLVKNPSDEFPDMQQLNLQRVLPHLEPRNDAISGTTSVELLEFSLPRLEVQPPDVFGIVLLTTGGNDLIHNYGRTPPRETAMYGATIQQAQPWIENFEIRLAKILNEIEARFPGGCGILLANIYDPTDGVGDVELAGLPAWEDGLTILSGYNDIIQRTCQAREHVHLIDLHATFLGHGIHCRQLWQPHYDAADPTYWYYDNLEDPNDRGYDAIRRLCLNAIIEHVKPRLALPAGALHAE